MEEDDDDLYGDAPTTAPTNEQPTNNLEDDDQEEEMDEETDSDSDDSIDIVTERPEGELASAVGTAITPRTPGNHVSAAIPIVAPPQQTSLPGLAGDNTNQTEKTAVVIQSGLQYPEIRTSTLDVNGTPIYEPLNKPITEVEIDADLVEQQKPWRRPGADQSDYFNYGFDEFTWSTYCLRQRTVRDAIVEQKDDNTKFEMMFGGGGGMMPGMPGMPGPEAMAGMGGMPGGGMGMPSEQELQAQMMAAMRQQGVNDPSKLDFNAFMATMGGPGGGGMMGGQPNIPSGPAAAQQNYGGGGGGGNWQGHGGGGGGGFRGKRGRGW
ncbi:Fip1-domain-containing protein [Microthyrium microscopicum]|uniref:Fip1-domain-containing protein n=1 Tax=Microthyrium microscopicum TaxID=703497 RepID=A0A6A6UMQ3_9PEZI|nr:Fip1-domain-containing protein [Microthyrium microscopicum]